jgi:Spy/CpxP family protein refolding chaperone
MKNSIAAGLVLAGMMCVGLQMASAQGMPGPGAMGAGNQAQMERPRPALERALTLPGMEGRWWVNPRVVEQLKISEEEQKTLDGILIEHREKLIDLRASLQKTELKMEELAMADKLDEAAVTEQIDRVAQARAELEKANAHYLLAIWSKLTPEQRTMVKEYRSGQVARNGWGGRGQMRDQMRPRRMESGQGSQPPATPAAPPAAPESK